MSFFNCVNKLCRGAALAVNEHFNEMIEKVRGFKVKRIKPRRFFGKHSVAEDKVPLISKKSSYDQRNTFINEALQVEEVNITPEDKVSAGIEHKSSCEEKITKDSVSLFFSDSNEYSVEEHFSAQFEKEVKVEVDEQNILTIANLHCACDQRFTDNKCDDQGKNIVLVCEELGVGDLILEDNILGRGGYGVVCTGQFATHLEDNAVKCTKVAVKSISISQFGAKCHYRPDWESQLRNNVETEIRAMLLCQDHKNIVQVKFVAIGDSEILCGLELAEKGDLMTYIEKNSGVRDPLAKKWFKDIADALLFCHNKGIVHCDIKAENILIDAQDNAKIADFGLARIADDPTNPDDYKLSGWRGTLPYMAPEMAFRRADDIRLCDVWSLGVLLYVMIAGYHPFIDTEERLNAWTGDLTFPSGFPVGPRCVVRRSLVVDARKRASMEEIVNLKWVKI